MKNLIFAVLALASGSALAYFAETADNRQQIAEDTGYGTAVLNTNILGVHNIQIEYLGLEDSKNYQLSLFSTGCDRKNNAAAFDKTINISSNQNGVLHANFSVEKEIKSILLQQASGKACIDVI